MASLLLKNIYKVYPSGVKAVSDFNLEIEDKEFIVLVGPSGCGKSTTLRMIAGLEEITAGELYIGGRLVNDVVPKDRDIAMVFQNYALYPHMSVYDNMAFGLKLRKMPKEEIDARVKEAARILGIEMFLPRKPKALSGGQRQRVALGRAIVREPKVFLLDEPLSNLDAKLRAQMRTEITKLHNRLATTFIYVTHDQIEAMTMGSRIVVMKDGYMQQVDTPQHLYDYPVNQFVAGFIGTPQMNFFDGTLSKEDGKIFVNFAGDKKIELPEAKIMKMNPYYLESGAPIVLGVRPEDIHTEEVVLANATNATVECKVEVVEKLGSETLLYCDPDTTKEEAEIVDKEGQMIARVNPRARINRGEIIKVAFDVNHIHLFDKETEMTLLPRIPQYNYIDAKIAKLEGGALEVAFEGQTVKLPADLAKAIEDVDAIVGTDAVRVAYAPSAFIVGKDGVEAKVVAVEAIAKKQLVHCQLVEGGRTIFVELPQDVEVGKTLNIAFDITKIILYNKADGEVILKALPAQSAVSVTVSKIAGDKNQKVVLNIAGQQLQLSETATAKMIANGGNGIYKAKLELQVSPFAIALVEAGTANAVQATVKDILDFEVGKAAYLELPAVVKDGAVVQEAESILTYVAEETTIAVGDAVTCAIDVDNSRIIEKSSEIVLL